MEAQTEARYKIYINETNGFLIFVSDGVQALLGYKSMADMVHCG